MNLCIIISEVSSLEDQHTPRACMRTERRLGGAAEAPVIDPHFQSILALTQLSGVAAGRLPCRYILISQASLLFIHFCAL